MSEITKGAQAQEEAELLSLGVLHLPGPGSVTCHWGMSKQEQNRAPVT